MKPRFRFSFCSCALYFQGQLLYILFIWSFYIAILLVLSMLLALIFFTVIWMTFVILLELVWSVNWIIDMSNIFRDEFVLFAIAAYYKNTESPIICYNYNMHIRSTLFDFNKINSNLDMLTYILGSWDSKDSNKVKRLIFHTNCLLGRHFAWSVKAYFQGNMRWNEVFTVLNFGQISFISTNMNWMQGTELRWVFIGNIMGSYLTADLILNKNAQPFGSPFYNWTRIYIHQISLR